MFNIKTKKINIFNKHYANIPKILLQNPNLGISIGANFNFKELHDHSKRSREKSRKPEGMCRIAVNRDSK